MCTVQQNKASQRPEYTHARWSDWANSFILEKTPIQKGIDVQNSQTGSY